MKKILLCISAVLLALSLTMGALAVPSSVTYRTTGRFLAYCDEQGIKYTYQGIDNDNDERVTVSYDLSSTSVDVILFFSEDGDTCAIRLWNLIRFRENALDDVLSAVNQLNMNYRWAKFFADTSDNTVTCSADIYFGGADAGDIGYYLLYRIVNISDYGYEDLARFDIG